MAAEQPTWQLLSRDECAAQWRGEDPLRFCTAVGDFDGDGLTDKAALVTGPGGKVGVAIWTAASKNGSAKVIFTAREIPRSMWHGAALGIKRMPPGRYKTLCGKMLAECSKGDPAEVEVFADGILLFKILG